MRRRLALSLLALAAACGPRPAADPQHAALQAGAPRGAGEVVTRRLLGEAQFNDYGFPTDDGRFISTMEPVSGDLAVRDLSTGALRTVSLKPKDRPSEAYAESSRMSPDGRRIAVAWVDDRDRYTIRVVDADGRNARVVYADSAYWYMEVNGFAPDNRHVIVELDRANGRFDYGWLDLDGGGIRMLFTNVPWVLGDVFFSPDGRFAAYNGSEVHPAVGPRDARILEIATGRTWPLLTWPSDETPVGWSPDGRFLVLQSDRGGTPGFWLQPVRDGRADGEARLAKADAWNATGVGVTRDGRLLYVVRTGAAYIYQATIDTAAGTVVGEPVRMDERDVTRYLTVLDVSRNGEWLVHNVSDPKSPDYGSPVLTFRSLASGETRSVRASLRRITGGVHWSPDDTRLLLAGQDMERRFGLFVVDVATGKATTVRLSDTTSSSAPVPRAIGWTPDGKNVLYRHYFPDSSVRLIAQDLATGATRELARQSHAKPRDIFGTPSPDGRHVATLNMTDDRKGMVLHVTDLVGGGSRELLRSTMPDQLNRVSWTADGRYLYVLRANAAESAWSPTTRLRIDRVSVADGRSRTIQTGLAGNYSPLAVHPDGRRVYFMAGHAGRELWEMSDFLPKAKAP